MGINLFETCRFSSKKSIFSVSVVIMLITGMVYSGSLSAEFINYDDKLYLFENPVIRQLDLKSLFAMFTSAPAGWWMPLTWLSFAIDYQIWGLNPFGFHLINTIIHSINAGIVVSIAAKVIQTQEDVESDSFKPVFFAALAGLLWSIHPLRVESVAWIAERKDVLNGFFALLSVYFYLDVYNSRPNGNRSFSSFLSIIFFYFSLGAKSVTVVLPLLLLSIDFFPLKQLTLTSLWNRVFEKIPYFIGSAIVMLLTFISAARSNFMVSYEVFPFSQRLAVSGDAVFEYLRFFLLPIGLSPVNVIPDPIPISYTVKAVVVCLIIIVVACSRRAWLQSCFLCFLLPLLPVLAFFQNGNQGFADHFTYLPTIAPSIAVAVFLQLFQQRLPSAGKALLGMAACLLIALYTILSMRMFPVWQSTEAFWSRVIEIQPISISYKERGLNYHLDGRFEEAVIDFTAALERLPVTLQPYRYNYLAFRASSLLAAGRYEEAIQDFSAAISMLPHPVYFHHRGLALKALGRMLEAEEDFKHGGTTTYPVVWFDRGL